MKARPISEEANQAAPVLGLLQVARPVPPLWTALDLISSD